VLQKSTLPVKEQLDLPEILEILAELEPAVGVAQAVVLS
jgi:hypothetical protein